MATYTTIASGNWTDSIWSPSIVYGYEHTYRLMPTHTVSVNGDITNFVGRVNI